MSNSKPVLSHHPQIATQINNFLNWKSENEKPPRTHDLKIPEDLKETAKSETRFMSKTSFENANRGFDQKPFNDSRDVDLHDMYGQQSSHSEMDNMRRITVEQDCKINDMRREIEDITNKFIMMKNTTQSEILNVREQLQSSIDRERTRTDQLMASSQNKTERHISEFERTVSSLEAQLKKLSHAQNQNQNSGKKITTSETATEIDHKLNELNENMKRSLKIMDVNVVELLREKDDALRRFSQDIYTVQSNLNIFDEQIAKLERNVQKKVDESQLYRYIETYIPRRSNQNETKKPLTSSIVNEQELDNRMKELETSFNNIALLERDMRGKYELYDLNLNSIKRHMELDLTVSLKQNIVPIQKNIEIYLQGVESRIASLEDIVMKEVRKESFILNEKDQTHSKPGKGYFTDQNPTFIKSMLVSNNIRESTNFNPNLLESQVDETMNKQPRSENMSPKNFIHTKDSNSKEPKRNEEKFEKIANFHNIQTHESVRFDEDEVEDSRAENNQPLANVAEMLSQDSVNPKISSLQGAISNIETEDSELPLLSDMPVPIKTTGSFKILYQDFIRKQSIEKTIKTSREAPKIRSQPQRVDDIDEDNDRLPAEESSTLEAISGLITNEDDVSSSMGKIGRTSSSQYAVPTLESRGNQDSYASPIKASKESENNEIEDFQGNIKGLLKKSRMQRESVPPHGEAKHLRQNNQQKNMEGQGFNRQQPGAGGFYNQQQNQNQNQLGKAPLPSKRPLGLDHNDHNPLPPLNVKGGKSFNQNKYSRPDPQNPMYNNQPFRGPTSYGQAGTRGLNNGGYLNTQQDEMLEGDDVEEIVYHVNEEGYLVDEQGNFLYDEDGNFIRLTPEQMQEIEENEIIYDEPEEDYY